MAVRSIGDKVGVVHKVKYVSDRGFNGTGYQTYCEQRLEGEKWAEPQYGRITCVRCLGTPKPCVWCDAPIVNPQLTSDTPERCDQCKD